MSTSVRLATVLALALVFAACGTGDDAGQVTEPRATPATSTAATSTQEAASPTAEPPTTPSEVSTTSGPATTSSSTTTTKTTVTSTTALPGEPIVGLVPAGATLAVFGVAHDDVLNVRAAPGTDQRIVARLDPLEDDVTALGEARRLTSSIWYLVEVDGTTGWASSRFLRFAGLSDDLTSLVVQNAGGYLVADTMEELGDMVAETLADPEASAWVMSVAPAVGDLGEVTYDLGGLADDAVWGWRLHVFGTPNEYEPGFTLKSVEATIFCLRAVDEVGSCV